MGMFKITLVSLIVFAILMMISCTKEASNSEVEKKIYALNENSDFQDFLTPEYYNTTNQELRNNINKYIYYTRLTTFQNPFKRPDGKISTYNIKRKFGDGIGMGGTSQHHTAIDMHLTNNEPENMYASHDGYLETYKNSSKYRHYLSITKEIKDDNDLIIGKLVSIYAHIDLDLDQKQLLQLNKTFVKAGDLISKNLYSETEGGAHLHFEIRFYRITDSGKEDFYNWKNSNDYTHESDGIWSFGYWNTQIGYGFGSPKNFNIE